MNKKKYFIFDMDGTILNTLDDLADSMNHCLSDAGYPERTRDEIRRFVGNGIHKLVERAVPEGTNEKSIEAVYENMLKYYQKHCLDKTRPYDGIPELLLELRKRGAGLAVVSNKADAAVLELCDKLFPKAFDFAAGQCEGYATKPSPDLVFKAMKAIDAVPAETVYIGDSDVDVLTAVNSGLDHIIVTWGFRDVPFLKAHGAKVFVDSPKEILEFN